MSSSCRAKGEKNLRIDWDWGRFKERINQTGSGEGRDTRPNNWKHNGNAMLKNYPKKWGRKAAAKLTAVILEPRKGKKRSEGGSWNRSQKNGPFLGQKREKGRKLRSRGQLVYPWATTNRRVKHSKTKKKGQGRPSRRNPGYSVTQTTPNTGVKKKKKKKGIWEKVKRVTTTKKKKRPT